MSASYLAKSAVSPSFACRTLTIAEIASGNSWDVISALAVGPPMRMISSTSSSVTPPSAGVNSVSIASVSFLTSSRFSAPVFDVS